MNMFNKLGLLFAIASIIIVFFHLTSAVLLLSLGLILFAINQLRNKNNIYGYIYLLSGFIFLSATILYY
ncbi:hypothetical protein FZC76_07920 [Sutcliffiella horikoshii]|uniref:DUF3953 domain-containing protein n=1 Tax=Sutcliffiella horikoshii TaxID=79883 RepID=A0A5D4T0B2_9BACI|nr:hypothetical protein [Sutcliffiella horikoshii]TYS68855.1 hypothetical protein FZC76_07920 [Sutcliffiella horikoshii]